MKKTSLTPLSLLSSLTLILLACHGSDEDNNDKQPPLTCETYNDEICRMLTGEWVSNNHLFQSTYGILYRFEENYEYSVYQVQGRANNLIETGAFTTDVSNSKLGLTPEPRNNASLGYSPTPRDIKYQNLTPNKVIFRDNLVTKGELSFTKK